MTIMSKDQEYHWLEATQNLLKNNFSFNIAHSYTRDCTVVVASKKIDDVMIRTVYHFDTAAKYNNFPGWVKELITAHRIIGVEEIR